MDKAKQPEALRVSVETSVEFLDQMTVADLHREIFALVGTLSPHPIAHF